MTEDLLAKEKEFHRLNRELEQKTRDLMKEVESVINVQNNEISNAKSNRPHSESVPKEKIKFAGNVVTLNGNHLQVAIKNASSTHISDQSLSVQQTEVQEDYSDEISCKKENGSTNKSIMNFFKLKIDMLQNELQMTRLEYKKKCDYCKELEHNYKKMDDFNEKLQNEIDSLRDTISKLEGANSDLQCQSQALNTENLVLKKDVDGLQKNIKVLNQQSSNYDMRLNRSLESNEKLRNDLKCSHTEEKELRNQIRRLQEDKRLAIKNLEKQQFKLVQAFKKQMLLVDNLKKQNACLAATGRIQFTEEDFSRLLDRKPECL